MFVVLHAFIIPNDLSFPASAQVPRTAGTRFKKPDEVYQWSKWQLWWEAHWDDQPPRTPFLVKSTTVAGLCQADIPPKLCWASTHLPWDLCSLFLCALPCSLPKLFLRSLKREKPLWSPCKSGMMTEGKVPCMSPKSSDSPPGSWGCSAPGI